MTVTKTIITAVSIFLLQKLYVHTAHQHLCGFSDLLLVGGIFWRSSSHEIESTHDGGGAGDEGESANLC